MSANADMRIEVLGHVRPESREHVLGQPLVRPVEAEIGRVEIEPTNRMFHRQVELFTQVGTPAREFGTDTFPSTEMRRQGLVDRGLVGLGEREEASLFGDVPFDELGVDAVADQLEEADRVADLSDLCRERRRVGRPLSEVELGDLGERRGNHRADRRDVDDAPTTSWTSAQWLGELVGVDDAEALRRPGERNVERAHAVLVVGDDTSGLDHDDCVEFEALHHADRDERDAFVEAGAGGRAVVRRRRR